MAKPLHSKKVGPTKGFYTSTTKATDVNASREGILMIISPAKTFDLSPISKERIDTEQLCFTQPDNCFQEQTSAIARSMKSMSKSQLATMLKLSPTLADTTKDYWSSFEIVDLNENSTKHQNKRNGATIEGSTSNSKPCIFMYNGPAYQGLGIGDIDIRTILYMQDNLRIIDAVYGLLKPLDIIQPYRLEMDTKNIILPNTTAPISKLSLYWSDSVTERLIHDLQQQRPNGEGTDKVLPILLNLASDEYSSTINLEQLRQHCQYIKIIFYEANHKVASVHSKRARGLMVRYISENYITTLEDVQKFHSDGYQFVSNESNANTLVFKRSSLKVKEVKTVLRESSSPTAIPVNTNIEATRERRNKRPKTA